MSNKNNSKTLERINAKASQSVIETPAPSIETIENNPITETATYVVTPVAPTTAKPVIPVKKSATKTQGIFQITGKLDTTVILKGSSSQIEICTRDYMSWCLKAKAPKVMQAEYDKQIAINPKLTPADIFSVSILKTCPKDADLKAAKTEFGLLPSLRQITPITAPEPQKPTIDSIAEALFHLITSLDTISAEQPENQRDNLLATIELLKTAGTQLYACQPQPTAE